MVSSFEGDSPAFVPDDHIRVVSSVLSVLCSPSSGRHTVVSPGPAQPCVARANRKTSKTGTRHRTEKKKKRKKEGSQVGVDARESRTLPKGLGQRSGTKKRS